MSLSISKINVLIVDDEYSGRNSLKIILQAKAYGLINKITTSSNLGDAKIKVSSNDFQIVFLDIGLGNHSGFELLLNRWQEYNKSYLHTSLIYKYIAINLSSLTLGIIQ